MITNTTNTYEKSQHFSEHRAKREKFIVDNIGLGNDINEFQEIDRKYGTPVLHVITDTGIYKIMSANKDTLITMWVARPQQLKDIYKKHHEPLPKWLLQKAVDHKQMGYCFIGENNPHVRYNHMSVQASISNSIKPDRRKNKIIY